MRYWFTADYHLGHPNIIKYCNRPFSNLQQMNETIIRNHNSRVKKDDIIFHNGDFCFKNSEGDKDGEGIRKSVMEWEQQLNGKFIHIKGNHDKNNSCKTIIKNLKIIFGNELINIVHDPMDYDEGCSINFIGHIHEKWKFRKVFSKMRYENIYLINIGVDIWKFMPVSFEEIIKEFNRWKKNGCPNEEEIL